MKNLSLFLLFFSYCVVVNAQDSIKQYPFVFQFNLINQTGAHAPRIAAQVGKTSSHVIEVDFVLRHKKGTFASIFVSKCLSQITNPTIHNPFADYLMFTVGHTIKHKKFVFVPNLAYLAPGGSQYVNFAVEKGLFIASVHNRYLINQQMSVGIWYNHFMLVNDVADTHAPMLRVDWTWQPTSKTKKLGTIVLLASFAGGYNNTDPSINLGVQYTSPFVPFGKKSLLSLAAFGYGYQDIWRAGSKTFTANIFGGGVIISIKTPQQKIVN